MPLRTAAGFAVAAACAFAQSKAAAPARTTELRLLTSDSALSAAFEWAKLQALQYVSAGGDPVGDWYEAALPNREAFCMRDVSHQAMGAHALGLARHNRNMLRKFAENVSDSKDWCSYWEINRQDLPAPVDYQSDDDFWYNLPANYDVLDACFRMYLWSGDRAYLEDPALLNFYRRSVDDYTARWDLQLDRILDRQRIMNVPGNNLKRRFALARGIPSYDEQRNGFIAGADLVAAQVAAYTSYARMHLLKGDREEARRAFDLATRTRAFLNRAWWDSEAGDYHAFALPGHKFAPGALGMSVLYYGAGEPSRIPQAVDALVRRIAKNAMNIEAQSHIPETLYRYAEKDLAYGQILDLSRPDKKRREYPEVSYAVIGAIVNGLMGIEPDPSRVERDLDWNTSLDGTVLTFPRLSQRTGWAELQNVPVRSNRISVRHDGMGRTTLTNTSGPVLSWRACLAGTATTLKINGRKRSARRSAHFRSGATLYCVDVQVPTGRRVVVAAQ